MVTIDGYLQKCFQLNRQIKQVMVQAVLVNLPDNLATNALNNVEHIIFGIHPKATSKNFQQIFNLQHQILT